MAIFGEQESYSVYLLNKYGVNKGEIVQIIAHGIDRAINTTQTADRPTELPLSAPGEGGDTLSELAVHLNEKARAGKN